MAQIFHRSFNTISRVSIFGAVFFVAALGWALYALDGSSYIHQAGVVRDQPVPFSHKHHVGGLGIDCRYCHTTVEVAASAGMPATEICMNCHTQIWADSPELEPVRESFRSGRTLAWTRVHDVPDFVRFDHSIHVAKGVGCAACHGDVDRMPLMWREHSLHMQWCLDCHRDPAARLRPREAVFDMRWQPPADQADRGRALARDYRVRSVTDCNACHQ
jgi:Zn ribbon nucleic-acid-binding protein